MTRRPFSTLTVLHMAATLLVGGAPTVAFAVQQAPAGPAEAAAPEFTYDTRWMTVPPQWTVGDISAVAVDAADHVWILHRPRSLPPEQRAKAAPPVMQFDRDGRFLRGWGGEGLGYDWPANEHSLFVDALDRVWISGNSRAEGTGDDAILAFTIEGKFIRQIGSENASQGDRDTANVKAVADLYVDTERHELYAADGYGNRRVIVFDTETGVFKRMWGAYGMAPPVTAPLAAAPGAPAANPSDAEAEGAADFGTVHGVEVSCDGLVYVSDRQSQRVQIFDRDGNYKGQLLVDRDAPNAQTASGLALSADPEQRWLFVIDFGNNRIVAYDRKTLALVATYGGPGRAAGEFLAPHLMAIDSHGVLYVAEVQGRRVQRLTPLTETGLP